MSSVSSVELVGLVCSRLGTGAFSAQSGTETSNPDPFDSRPWALARGRSPDIDLGRILSADPQHRSPQRRSHAKARRGSTCAQLVCTHAPSAWPWSVTKRLTVVWRRIRELGRPASPTVRGHGWASMIKSMPRVCYILLTKSVGQSKRDAKQSSRRRVWPCLKQTPLDSGGTQRNSHPRGAWASGGLVEPKCGRTTLDASVVGWRMHGRWLGSRHGTVGQGSWGE